MKRRAFALIAAAGGLLVALPLPAQEISSALPLRDVVLFSSGVGYFGREGRVQGDATVDLSFRAEQVNDILKSLVLFDSAGAVRPVTYTTQDAIARRLGNTAGQALDANVTLGALLRRFQGARVRLETGAEAVEGRIVSVSLKALPVKDGSVQTEVLNILTDGGLRAVSLEQVSQVRLLDERLDRELRESLELLATGLDDRRRVVQLRFSGNGAREVRAGYLQETPIWKTSYRLVLDKDAQPYLQGWGIVENTTDEDWANVRLSLVSGRPVSFIQDLYQPLYVPRPVIQAQVIGSPVPQTYGETLDADLADGVVDNPPPTATPGPPGPPGAPAAREPAPSAGGVGGSFARGSASRSVRDAESLERRRGIAVAAKMQVQSVAAQASGAERGDLFEYAISQPVTLPRGKAAMVPIVTESIAGERVSIFDPASDSRRALRGFKLKNSTKLHLAGGPITVFQEGVYAGDAQISNVQPGEDRLLSYAVDLDLVADHEEPKFRQDTVSVVAKSGVLHVTRKQRREHTYTFRNKSDAAKTVLIQQPLEDGFKLVEPAKPAETTPDEYRFSLPVAAKQAAALKVVTERPVTEQLMLLNMDLNVLTAYAQNAEVSQPLRAALKQLVEHRRRITDLQAQRAKLEGEIRSIDQEQNRIRQNMAQLDRNSPLYQQYVKKLTDQETRIEQVRAEIARLQEQEVAAQSELRAFVETLTVE